MNSISAVRAVITPSYQGASPHTITEAFFLCVTCKKRKGKISVADIEAFNDAVEHVIPVSAETAAEYCATVFYHVWETGYCGQNSIAAGVAIIALALLAMSSHVADETVQIEGAKALAALAYGNPVNLAGMLALGAPNTLYLSADAHIASGEVQDKICGALYWMAVHSTDVREALRNGRAADVATRAKDLYPDIDSADGLLKMLSAVYGSC